MRKVFFSTMPMQKVEAVKYESPIYPESSNTAYPITISVENNCKAGDHIVLVSVVTHSAEKNLSEINYELYQEQVKKIVKEKGATLEFVKVAVEVNPTPTLHRELYQKLIDCIKDGDKLFADITYGFKFNPIVLFSALNYGYQAMQDVDVKEIFYAQYYNGTDSRTPKYYDITALFYMNSINCMTGLGD